MSADLTSLPEQLRILSDEIAQANDPHINEIVGIDLTRPDDLAAMILRSDWLAAHDHEVAAGAVEAAAEAMDARLNGFPQQGRHTRARWAEDWLTDRAQAIREGRA